MFGKKFTKEPTEKQRIGKIGEDFACQYLEKNGYKIVARNYLRKWGEIDIIAMKAKRLHFIEVKSVSRQISGSRDGKIGDTGYRPEDNMHPWKLKRLGRAVQSYLLEKDTRLKELFGQVSDDIDWQFDVVTVYIDMSERISRVFLMEDVVL